MNLTRVSALFKKSVKYFFLFFVGYYLLVYIVIPGSSNIIQSILTKKTTACAYIWITGST